jgi:hypothetical protein
MSSDLIYLELCNVVSDTRGPLPSTTKGFYLVGDAEVSSGRVAFYWNEPSSELVVVCRGSGGDTFLETLRNAVYDLNFFSKGKLQVHRGIYNHCQKFFEDTWFCGLAKLVEDEYRPKKVTLTGFSLGGGMAQLLALWLFPSSWKKQIVTFGSPLVTKRPQVVAGILRSKRYVRRIFHYEMLGDIIPQLPPFPGWGPLGVTKEMPKVYGPEHSRKKYMAALGGD